MIKYDVIVDYNKIDEVYRKICGKTKHKTKLVNFELSKFTNFVNIYTKLKNKEYCHGKYNIFLIKIPKHRIIMSECLDDKIVNHLVSLYILFPLIEPHLLDINVATRKDKGLEKGFLYIKNVFNLIRNDFDDYYALKCDVNKYFYSIDHDILFEKLGKIITDKDIITLLRNIIDSTNSSYVNQGIEKLVNSEINSIEKLDCDKRSKQKQIDKLKKIPLYKKGKGLPIGNMTSQLLAIFYLNDLDHFIKEKLHIKYYMRYMDDFILFHKDKEYLKYCEKAISEELAKLKLTLNEKTGIIKLSNGLTFLGYRFINKNKRTYILMNKTMRKKIRKRYKKDGEIILKKYNGYLKRCVSKKYKNNLLLSKKG